MKSAAFGSAKRQPRSRISFFSQFQIANIGMICFSCGNWPVFNYKQISIDAKELVLELFHVPFYGQQSDLKFAFSRVKILAPRLHAPIEDKARRHEVTSLLVT